MKSIDQIDIKKVTKIFNQPGRALTVIDDVSISFNRGQTYALCGVSGSGKSTLLHMAAGFETPTQGEILWNSTSLATLPTHLRQQAYRTGLGFAFQHHYLIAELTAQENLMLVGKMSGMAHEAARSRAQELLALADLKSCATQYPRFLSGGQQQRLALLRALFNKPQFLFADEPTGNLDADNAQRVVDLMLHGVQTWEMGLIMCTHDALVAGQMQHQLVLEHCKIRHIQ